MLTTVEKAFAYITHEHRLLLFRHPYADEAGIQVPAGTLKPGETPEDAVMREALEETGLPRLVFNRYLGDDKFPRPERSEVHHRHFFHLTCADRPLESWRHFEPDPLQADQPPIIFEFFWAALPNGIPPLAPGHDKFLSVLVQHLQ